MKVGVVSLGCAKNLVDSEVILGYLGRGGFEIVGDLLDAEIVVVNTCAFLTEAEDEAFEVIEELVDLKRRGRLSLVLVTGCLLARRGMRLAERLPDVDAFLFACDIPRVATVVKRLMSGADAGGATASREVSPAWYLYDHRSPRVRATPLHWAYIKVSEGCDNGCSYCLIPSIKGGLRSRDIGSVVKEAAALAAEGVKEINVISQDTTAFGTDVREEGLLVELLNRLSDIEGIEWIRLLYGHPARCGEELVRCIAAQPKICDYVDFPLQHINDRILDSMNRKITKRQVCDTLAMVRELIPGVTVRTTFIVGYPGETEDDFEELLQFVKEQEFYHVGAFMYSREEGTVAAVLPRQVSHELKRARFHRLMTAQREVVEKLQERKLGGMVELIIDEELEEGSFGLKGRTRAEAPEVDGDVYIVDDIAPVGEIVQVRIVGMTDYDLVAASPGIDPGTIPELCARRRVKEKA
jgi:ribosomal protein S12 methylthiotransferase